MFCVCRYREHRDRGGEGADRAQSSAPTYYPPQPLFHTSWYSTTALGQFTFVYPQAHTASLQSPLCSCSCCIIMFIQDSAGDCAVQCRSGSAWLLNQQQFYMSERYSESLLDWSNKWVVLDKTPLSGCKHYFVNSVEMCGSRPPPL